MRALTDADTVEGTLKSMLGRADHFAGVIVLGLNKDGTQYLEASHFSMIEKIFLVQFAQAWATAWFEAQNMIHGRSPIPPAG